ncbi:MAG: hypothetical protein ABIJ08_05715 [Nanoarchaeota archaeon]
MSNLATATKMKTISIIEGEVATLCAGLITHFDKLYDLADKIEKNKNSRTEKERTEFKDARGLAAKVNAAEKLILKILLVLDSYINTISNSLTQLEKNCFRIYNDDKNEGHILDDIVNKIGASKGTGVGLAQHMLYIRGRKREIILKWQDLKKYIDSIRIHIVQGMEKNSIVSRTQIANLNTKPLRERASDLTKIRNTISAFIKFLTLRLRTVSSSGKHIAGQLYSQEEQTDALFNQIFERLKS